MSATVSLCQRTGASPGQVSENISSISWKALDDTFTPYDSFNAIIGLGTNSFQVYNYLRFKGVFTTIANVKIKHISGVINSGARLVSSPSITQTTDRLLYVAPSKNVDNGVTPNDFSPIGSTVSLLVGDAPPNYDGAAYDGKSNAANNLGRGLYTNYFVSQLQVSPSAATGDLDNVAIQITYDEL